MTKSLEDAVLEASLLYWGTATVMHICAGEPTGATNADRFNDMVAKSLATAVLSPSDFSGPLAGDTDGRKNTLLAKLDLPIDFSGTADHVATGITAGTEYLGTTTCDPQALTAGGTVSTGAYDYEQGDPT